MSRQHVMQVPGGGVGDVRRASPTGRVRGAGIHPVHAFVVFALACTVVLILPGIEPVRTVCRMAVFGASLMLLAVLPMTGVKHPASKPALAAWLILLLGMLHPETGWPLAGIATLAMYAAVLAPLMWVSALRADVGVLRGVAMILWSFHTLSAAVGVLQMYVPERFEPEPSAVFLARGEAMVEGARITLVSGDRVFRPMGLSDLPGGAANSGLACVVFALGIMLVDRRAWLRALCIASIACGVFVIHLSQIRSILVMVLVCVAVLGLIIACRGDRRSLAMYGTIVGGVLLSATVWAWSVGGEATMQRLLTLIEEDPLSVYYFSRGHYLQQTWVELLPRYPFGAGLGRWGMVQHYFGGHAAHREPLWAEIQWTAWLYDGGAALVIAYTAAVLAAVWVSWTTAVNRRLGELSLWAAVLCASNVAVLAVTFNYPIFMSQGGMEFWLLNACLWGARRHILGGDA